ncbi:SURF1 family protein [Salinibacterium hongtaonis]|uniref:SURF1-like protein n=1 Tax=Homoserinimonas hongtaonis TaxID=2079791 RepID=A0A2U1T2I5_9MICO|nr:SURF1 family cytochrome oxidase biogenesis protein [Salinibacterium hongtaonis]AWB88337.1 hypothetical protein C2138_01150 [Salinibacterium hongtaonis]PWB98092.1 hypothetical protein DF220_09835 [Salinibacterium hongtaonis]
MWAVARRPRWIAALALALGIAAAFAALGQWQLERSFASGDIVTRETEKAVPLDELARPGAPMQAAWDGQLVTVEGEFVADDFLVIGDRFHDGTPGYWVLGHLVTTEGVGLAAALGWAENESDAVRVSEELAAEAAQVDANRQLVALEGRYAQGEGPQDSDLEGGRLTTVSPPALVNIWSQFDEAGTFGGYLIVDEAVDGLESIDAPIPSGEVEINWLNIFYAVEWAVFAGFAVFLWWRLVKDAWELEVEEAAAAASGESAPSGGELN